MQVCNPAYLEEDQKKHILRPTLAKCQWNSHFNRHARCGGVFFWPQLCRSHEHREERCGLKVALGKKTDPIQKVAKVKRPGFGSSGRVLATTGKELSSNSLITHTHAYTHTHKLRYPQYSAIIKVNKDSYYFFIFLKSRFCFFIIKRMLH
jgi:tRNA A37 threonylcarbamoyltransferase TsaD